VDRPGLLSGFQFVILSRRGVARGRATGCAATYLRLERGKLVVEVAVALEDGEAAVDRLLLELGVRGGHRLLALDAVFHAAQLGGWVEVRQVARDACDRLLG